MVFAAFVVVGCVNAVNITDGLDGLATSVTIPVALFFGMDTAVKTVTILPSLQPHISKWW